MAIDSKHLVNAGVALALVGVVAWATSVVLTTPVPAAGTVEVRPLAFSADTAPADTAKK